MKTPEDLKIEEYAFDLEVVIGLIHRFIFPLGCLRLEKGLIANNGPEHILLIILLGARIILVDKIH